MTGLRRALAFVKMTNLASAPSAWAFNFQLFVEDTYALRDPR